MVNHDQSAVNLGESLLEEGRGNEPRGPEYTNSLRQSCSAESVLKFITPFTMSIIGLNVVFVCIFIQSVSFVLVSKHLDR